MHTTEFYRSSNGDRWLLCDGANAVVRHVPNAASGGSVSDKPVAEFLSENSLQDQYPQHDALRIFLARNNTNPNLPDEPDAARKPTVEALLLTAVRVRTFVQARHLTNASGFFFARGERLFLVTSRHVLVDAASQHFPDRIEIELHVDRDNLGASAWASLPLYDAGMSLWRQASDTGGEIDVAVLEVPRHQLPLTAVFAAFRPEHLPASSDAMPIGASVLIVGFPLGFHDSLHHLPVVRQGIIASAFGLRFQGKGCFITDARTHRGTSGAPVVISRHPADESGASCALPWRLLGIHSSTIDMTTRDLHVDESLGLNSAWYADVLMSLTEDRLD
ncbi:serine protease [Caballeronia sp. LZ029]|uniref:S1 family peptidase n=1 Tax=Caballeronia sp. LZ029 TaxID=3038564 RepID=UPI00286B1B4D|nr:serine protease [Caballeronia sp. LZ029]